MKVIVWKSYGDIDVYSAATAQQVENVINLMIECSEDWGIQETIEDVKAHIEEHVGDYSEMVKAFNMLRYEILKSNHESFEDIYLTRVQDA